ncbi:prolyl oligopeptidase family serine peptidase [bacterium]|nr:prolyl oligopeptidase family serine peptidase [bacterium]
MSFLLPAQAQQSKEIFTLETEYLLFFPELYGADTSKKWPLIIFLHGSGERGNDLEKVKTHGPPKIVETDPSFPFVVVSPQCSEGAFWSPMLLDKVLDNILVDHRIDPAKVYLTGLSMGGYGTWDWVSFRPDRFAAIAPICGEGDTTQVKHISHIPTWIFHGLQDKVVPPQNSSDMSAALKRSGAKVKLTLYPEAGHDSWTETYANPALYEWFLSHTNPNPDRPAIAPWKR